MNNKTLLDTAKKFGTPTYIYNAETIQNQYTKLKNAFDGIDVKLHYALKALNNINVLRLLKKEEISSWQSPAF